MNLKPYGLVLYEAVQWWLAFYKNEINEKTDPLSQQKQRDALEGIIENISKSFGRKPVLVRSDLINIIENNIIPDLMPYKDDI